MEVGLEGDIENLINRFGGTASKKERDNNVQEMDESGEIELLYGREESERGDYMA